MASGLHGALVIGPTVINWHDLSAMQNKRYTSGILQFCRFVKCAFHLGYFQFMIILLGHNPIVS